MAAGSSAAGAADEPPLHEHIRRRAREHPGKTAVIWYGREIRYGELDRLSDACAAVLDARGVQAGEPVALFMQNCPQYLIAHLGIQKLGAIVSPCSPLFKSHELGYQLADLGARVIVAAGDLYPVVQAAMPESALRHVMLTHYRDLLPETPSYAAPALPPERIMPPDTVDLWAAIQGNRAAPPRRDVRADDVALLMYTSGTTGRPKGAMLTFGNVMFKTAGLARAAGLRPDDVHLAIPPLYHISGMLYGMNLPLYTGAAVVLHYRFDALSAAQSIERHRVTYWKGIAPMLASILDTPAAARCDASSLRVTSASSFGIRMSPELSRRWADFTGGCIATEAGYGLTETHTGDVITLPDSVRWGTNGRLLPGVRCRIADFATGRDLPAGEQGEILLKSPGNFRGYWKQPGKTAETLRDGWVHTGDIGVMDEDGYLTLIGRVKEMIKVSGYSVFPEDVEAILAKHPLVERAAVTGVADASKGEVVKAVVIAREGLSADALIAWCRDNMSAYKVPRHVEFRRELPLTGSGKVMRRLL